MIQDDRATKRGDILTLGRHRVMCGDATAPHDVAKLFDGDRAEILFTSPPYLQQRDYGAPIKDWAALMQGAFSNLPLTDEAQIFVNLGQVHRRHEWIPYWDGWIEWMRRQGWRRFGWYVWDQGTGIPCDPAMGRLWRCFEFIFHFNRTTRPPRKTRPTLNAGRRRSPTGQRRPDGRVRPLCSPGLIEEFAVADSVIRVKRFGQRYGHPAPFPVDLPLEFLKSWPGGVYDPFIGSGSTLVAADRLGLVCRGMEIEPTYCDIIRRRWADQAGDQLWRLKT